MASTLSQHCIEPAWLGANKHFEIFFFFGRGVKDVLKKRLKNYYKKEKLMHKQPNNGENYYDYICVIDFEATCEEGNQPEFTHEIIEFPIVLLNTQTLEIVSGLVSSFLFCSCFKKWCSILNNN